MSAMNMKDKRTVTGDEVEITRNAWSGLPIFPDPRDEMQLNRVERIRTSYYHYMNPGEGVIVYVYDTGCRVNHPEFENTKFQDWITGGSFPGEEGANVWADGPHRTTIVNKIAGKNGGIAQEAEIVVASIVDENQIITHEMVHVLDTLLKMYDHIRSQNADRPCVINIVAALITDEPEDTHPKANFESAMAKAFQDILTKLLKLENVIIVACAGK
ncbi:hypothetical protein AA313_de0206275 [Arthrobotrys entomopaga]|nr:hypothetical protein AA313_de0206275 [Arthrobotrys entomopaga]